MTKKIFLFVTNIFLFLASAIPVSAQVIDPCPRGGGAGFGTICNYNASTLTNVIRNGITILLIVATIASIFFLILGGIKWITSGGDKGKLDESRNWIVASIVGLVITLASYFIINFVLGLFGLSSIGTYTIPNLVSP